MNNFKTFLGTIVLLSSLVSCSTVKVADTWREVDTIKMQNKSILVVSKTENKTVRERFESDLASQFQDNGYQANESFNQFADLTPVKEGNIAELKKLGESVKAKGYDVVVLTVLRDIEEYTKTETTATTYTVQSYPVYYHRRGYYRSFYRGFGTIYVEGAPYETITSTNRKYILETYVYDLTLPEDNQLLSIVTSEVDNPETLGKTSKDFSKKLANVLL